MPIQELIAMNQCSDRIKYLHYLLTIHCAPTLKGNKVANIITIKGDCFHYLKKALQNTAVSFFVLKSRHDMCIVYLYRKELLLPYMHSENILRFLAEFGYQQYDLEEMLNTLSERIFLYDNGDSSFPHEIGVFLGYPLDDVTGFIQNNGKNYLYSGYWKVYDNPKQTKKLFEQYDYDRETAFSELLAGKSISDIIH